MAVGGTPVAIGQPRPPLHYDTLTQNSQRVSVDSECVARHPYGHQPPPSVTCHSGTRHATTFSWTFQPPRPGSRSSTRQPCARHAALLCALSTDDDTLPTVDMPDLPFTPSCEAVMTEATERRVRKLRHATGSIVKAMCDLRHETIQQSDKHTTGKKCSRLMLALHNAIGVLTIHKRLQGLFNSDDPPPIWQGIDLIVVPECKATTKNEPEVQHMFGQMMSPRGTSEQRMSPLDIDVVCSKHPGGMIRHGNAIAYLRTFVADCRAWRVRTNLVVVSSRIRQMQDLSHPSKYDALSLDRTGSIESTFTGERDTEWYSDSPSDDGRWVEIVG